MDLFVRIVVGIDGTAWGVAALEQVLALAPPNAPVDAVTALSTRPAGRAGFDAPHWVEILTNEASTAQKTAVEILEGRADARARVVRGDPIPVLRRARDEGDATLLALGGRHSSRFLGIMLGDTASELLHEAACSILIARPYPEGRWRPRRVVVGVDGSAPSLAALAAADELGARLGSTLLVVSATDGTSPRPEGTWTERVDRWDTGHPAGALVERSREADLVVVGSRGLHGLRAIGSVSERVAHHARGSVLVVHAG
jgi:nucleotide-binding universal stress UspA family protein